MRVETRRKSYCHVHEEPWDLIRRIISGHEITDGTVPATIWLESKVLSDNKHGQESWKRECFVLMGKDGT